MTQTKRRVVKAQGGLFLERISQLTLESVREHELTEASLAEKAADIVAGEQQVALTSNSREQLNSLLQMESEATPAKASAAETSPTRTRRASPNAIWLMVRPQRTHNIGTLLAHKGCEATDEKGWIQRLWQNHHICHRAHLFIALHSGLPQRSSSLEKQHVAMRLAGCIAMIPFNMSHLSLRASVCRSGDT